MIIMIGFVSGCVEYKDITAPEWEEPVYVER